MIPVVLYWFPDIQSDAGLFLSRTSRLRRILPDSDPSATPQTSLWLTSDTHGTRPFYKGVAHIQSDYNTNTMGMDILIHARTTELVSKINYLYFPTIPTISGRTSVPLNNPEQTDKLGRLTTEMVRIGRLQRSS